MAVDEQYFAYIEDQLSTFGDFTSRKMFGGVGFFRNKVMFAGIMDNVFRLKGDATTAPDYAAYGKGPWSIPGKKGQMPYYEVPEEILSDRLKLAEWAEKAYLIALKGKQ